MSCMFQNNFGRYLWHGFPIIQNDLLRSLHALSWPGVLDVLHEADWLFLLAEMRTPKLQIANSSIWCTAWRLHAGLLMKQVRF